MVTYGKLDLLCVAEQQNPVVGNEFAERFGASELSFSPRSQLHLSTCFERCSFKRVALSLAVLGVIKRGNWVRCVSQQSVVASLAQS